MPDMKSVLQLFAVVIILACMYGGDIDYDPIKDSSNKPLLARISGPDWTPLFLCTDFSQYDWEHSAHVRGTSKQYCQCSSTCQRGLILREEGQLLFN